MFVKGCGITNAEDAHWAVHCGASALGFVFCSSPRRVTPEEARVLCEGLPSRVRSVGLFVDAPLPRVREVAAYCGLDLVQLHGNPSPGACRRVGWPCTRQEGLVPALESAHALARAFQEAAALPGEEVVLVNLSGRGDKDVFTIAEALGDPGWQAFLRSRAEADHA